LRIIARRTLKEFWLKHHEVEEQLKTWYHDAKNSDWHSPHDIKDLYPSASLLGDNRVVFNIKGNRFRLIVKINYDFQIIYIRFIGTHSAYDKIDAEKI